MHLREFMSIVIGAFLFIPAPALPGSGPAPTNPAQMTAFRDVKVFDGVRWHSRWTVVIQGDKITAAGPDVEVPEGAEVIGGDGWTLIPGLIDSHVHAFSLGDLRQSAIFGVTTLLDMMSSPAFVRQVKARLNGPGGAGLADFRSAGTAAVCPGGHGTEWGSRVPTLTRPDEAADFIEARLAEGSDYLKIMYGMAKRVLPIEVVEALAREAKKRGILTLVHTETRATALAAVRAGVDGLAHAFADTPPEADFIETMKAARAFVIPTLSVMHRLKDARKIDLAADGRLTDYLVPEVIDCLTKAQFPPDSDDLFYRVAEETVRRLNQAGIPVLAGTDLGNPGSVPGASLHTELERLAFAGLTPTEALAAATSRPADVFGLKDRGRIAAGLRADLLLVKGDPEQAITGTREIAGVWLRGSRVDRAAWRAEMERQKKEWGDSGEIPPPVGSESGLIGDFDSGEDLPRFGFCFFDLSDKMMGGASTAAFGLAGEGAEGTPGSLKISGKIEPAFPKPFAGICFFPGTLIDSLANLSRWDAVAFWVKGDVSQGTVMIMADMRSAPRSAPFPVTGEWRKVTVPFKDLGADGRKIMGLIIGAADRPGPFEIRIDGLRLVKTE